MAYFFPEELVSNKEERPGERGANDTVLQLRVR